MSIDTSACKKLALTLKALYILAKPEQRLYIVEQLTKGYCIDCGYELDHNSVCHCTNDE